MQKIVVYLLFVTTTTVSHSFFLQSKEFRKFLRLFPKAFEIETKPRLLHRREHNHNDNLYDSHNRYDNNEDNRKNNHNRNLRRQNSGRYAENYHCDHPDHHHHYHDKHLDEKKHLKNRNKYDNIEEIINDKKDYNSEKKTHETENEKNSYEKEEEHKTPDSNYNNKDYITGILVTIPKHKVNADLNYYKDNKNSALLQHFLKTDDDEDYQEHHTLSEDDIKSFY